MVLGIGDWLRQRVKRGAPANREDSVALPDRDPDADPSADGTVIDARPPEVRPADARPPDARPEGRGVDAAKLADAVRRLVKDHRGRTAGAIHLINLHIVRERMGDRWPAMAERLLAGIEVILDNRLSAADLYIRIEGPSYLIVFGEIDHDAAKLKCALIGHEIEKHVFGDDVNFAEISVRASVFRLDDAAKDRGEEIDLLGIIGALKTGAEQTVPGERRGPEAPAAGPDHRRHAFEDGGLPPIPNHEPPPPAHGPQISYVLVPIYQTATTPPSSFVFRPVWHTRQDAIATYLCQPMWVKSDGVGSSGDPFVEYQLAYSGEGDIATLEEVCRTFRALAADRRRVLLSMSVHLETIARSATRKEFLAVAAGLSQSERRFLSIEFAGIDETVPHMRLTELVSVIQPFCRGVILRCGLERRRFAGVREARIHAVGVEVGAGHGHEAGLLAKLDDFAGAAATAGLRSYAHGLRSRSLTSGAIASGFDFVDGDPVATLRERPSNAYRFGLADLYRGSPEPTGARAQ